MGCGLVDAPQQDVGSREAAFETSARSGVYPNTLRTRKSNFLQMVTESST